MNIGVGVGAKDSKAGRQLGLRRSTTVDRWVGVRGAWCVYDCIRGRGRGVC